MQLTRMQWLRIATGECRKRGIRVPTIFQLNEMRESGMSPYWVPIELALTNS